MKKINICYHIMDMSNCGGTERVTSQIVNKLVENKKYNIFILSNYNQKEKLFFDVDERVQLHSFYKKKKRFKIQWLDYIFKTKKFIKKNKIDLLITVDSFLGLVDIPAVKGTKCKNIIWEHFDYYRAGDSRLVKLAKKLCVKSKTNIVVLTKKDYENFHKNEPNMKAKMWQIYNPYIDNVNKKDFKFNNNTIISCGRLVTQKGFDYLLEVAKKLKENNNRFKWLILGEGELHDELIKKQKEYNLEDYVQFVGKVHNVDDYYDKADFYVLTSRNEGFGLVLLEARTHFLPIVSFDINNGPSEIIKDNINGYLIPKFDIDMMVKKIEILLNSRKKLDEFKKNSMCGFDAANYDDIITKWSELIDEIAK